MDSFYFIVLVTASVILILLLTFIGTLLYTSKSTTKFPPATNICPDYWDIGADKTCQYPQVANSRNVGNLKAGRSGTVYQVQDTATPGLNTDKTRIDFSHPGWATLYPSTTSGCAKKKWAIDNSIEWDGVSNSAIC